MSEYISYIRSHANGALYKQYCELLREDLLVASNELAAMWDVQQFSAAAELVHGLRDLFGTLDYEEGKSWCDRVGRNGFVRPLEILQSERARHIAVALDRINDLMSAAPLNGIP